MDIIKELPLSTKLILGLLGFMVLVFAGFLFIRVGLLQVESTFVDGLLTPQDSGGEAVPTPAPGVPVLVAGANVDINNGPGSEYEKIGSLESGQPAEIVGVSGDGFWWAIRVPLAEGGRGWVADESVSTGNTSIVPVIGAQGEVSLDQPFAPGKPSLTLVSEAEVHAGPGGQYGVVGQLEAGQNAEVIGVSGDGLWYAVASPYVEGGTGWIFRDLAQARNAGSVPVLAGESSAPSSEETAEAVAPLAIAIANVNIRGGPDRSYAKVGLLEYGQSAEVIGMDESHSWLAVKAPTVGSGYGWIAGDYVTTSNTEDLPVVNDQIIRERLDLPVTQGGIPLLTTITIVNVRSGPGTQFETIGKLDRGQGAEVSGRSEDGAWWQIRFPTGPDGRGWVSAEFVKAENAFDVQVIK